MHIFILDNATDIWFNCNRFLLNKLSYVQLSSSYHASCCVTESLYVFPCQWNYRPDHCIYGSNCQQAEQEGVFILHGNRGVYHDDKQPAFRAVYQAIQKVEAPSLTRWGDLWLSEQYRLYSYKNVEE